MVRRYEPMDGENVDYDDYSRYQQPRKKPRDGGGVGRYEVGRPSLQSLQANVKGKFLTIYTNGEKFKYDPPVKVMFSKKKFPKLGSLLDEIGRAKERINKTAVVYLFKWPSGEKVEEVNEIEEDEETNTYICSDVRSLFKRGRYGGVEFGGGAANSGFANSRSSHDSRATARSDKPSPTGARPYGQMNGASRGPITINIISNTNRESRQSLFIDPRSNQPFEAILKSIEEMIEMEYPPCKALFSIKKPYKKVDSISSLNRIVPVYGDTFWACGKEGEPPDKSSGGSRDVSPMRNGGNQKGKQNGYHEDKVRQSDGHIRRSEAYEDSRGREYQRHHDQYEEDEDPAEEDQDYDREPSPPRNRPQNLKDHSPRRDSKPATDRSNKGRYEDESQREDEPPKKLQKPRQETKPPPKKNTIGNKNKTPRDEDDTDEGRYEDENQRDDEPPKKLQKSKQETKPAPKKNTKENKNKTPRDEDDTDEERSAPKKNTKENKKKTPRDEDDTDEERTAPKKNTKGNNRPRGDGDDSDDDSRGNSPTESEMQARIDAMDRAKSDLDKDIEF